MKRVIKKIVRTLYYSVVHSVQAVFRFWRNRRIRKRLVNKTPSIIGDNCNVGVMYHDMGIPFFSPTINLYIYPDDYIKFLSNLRYYLSCDITELHEDGVNYPIGLLGDIRVYFMHYESFEQAKIKWHERCKRVDFDNLFIVMTKRSYRCTEEHIRAFDALPYKNKVIFTNNVYPDVESNCYIRGFEKKDGVGVLLSYKFPALIAKRFYEDFDYIDFINRGMPNG